MQATRISFGWITQCQEADEIAALLEATVVEKGRSDGVLKFGETKFREHTKIIPVSIVRSAQSIIRTINRQTKQEESKVVNRDILTEFELQITPDGNGRRGIVVATGGIGSVKAANKFLVDLSEDDDSPAVSGCSIVRIDLEGVMSWFGRHSMEATVISAKLAGYESHEGKGPYTPRFKASGDGIAFLSDLEADVVIKSFAVRLKVPGCPSPAEINVGTQSDFSIKVDPLHIDRVIDDLRQIVEETGSIQSTEKEPAAAAT